MKECSEMIRTLVGMVKTNNSLIHCCPYKWLSIILMLILSVCLSPVRSRERNVVLPRFFHRRKEILLASYTNCFSSLYDVWFEGKSLWNFSAGYTLKAVHALDTLRLPWAGWILPTARTLLEHSRRSRVPKLISLLMWTGSWLHNKKSTSSWTGYD